MKLYEYKGAPSPRRIRIFLAEKGVNIATVQVDLGSGENLKPEYLSINPRGLVPTLQLDDGTCIDETMAICRYFEELYPQPPLMGTDARSKAIIESRTRHIEFDGLFAVADAFRNTTPAFANRALPGVTDPVAAIPQLAQRGFAAVDRFFDGLNRYLGGNEYVAGERFSNADIVGLCVVDFARWIKRSIPEQHSHSLRWYQAVSSRPSAKA
jgi:glutathione S-transferase